MEAFSETVEIVAERSLELAVEEGERMMPSTPFVEDDVRRVFRYHLLRGWGETSPADN
ncbi:MAG: hypothetical protein AB7V46_17315 [Thermomicrobiales bacterium]